MMTHWMVPLRSTRRAAPVFGDFSSFDRIMSDLWRGSPTRVAGSACFAPSVNVEEGEDEIRLTAELPGLDEKDFDLSIDGDLLVIKGEKKFEREAADAGYTLAERGRGSFRRSFRVPWEVDPDTVNASYVNGVLEVVIPKPDEMQPQARTIPVTTS